MCNIMGSVGLHISQTTVTPLRERKGEKNIAANNYIKGGCFMTARRYEIFKHSKRRFVSPRGHVIFY